MRKDQEVLPAVRKAAVRKSAPRAERSDQLKAQAHKHPGAALAGGLVLGLMVGSLLPRGTARRLAKGAATVAAIGGETGLNLARLARNRAHSAAGDAAERLQAAEQSAEAGVRRLRRNAADVAGSATSAASSTGRDLARAAIRLLASLKR